MKFALLSVTYSGLFYAGEPLTIEQQIRKAKQLGFDALAIETKRPVAFPLDLTKADRSRIRSVAADEGVALCAVESMSNFCSRYMEERENNLAMMRLVFDLAHDLGVGLVKIFAAWPGLVSDEEPLGFYATYEHGSYHKPLDTRDLAAWSRGVSGIREVASWAADLGITLALQNHAPVLRPGYEDTLAMVREVDRPNVKICLDVPLFAERQNTEYVCAAVEACGDLIVHSHYGAWNFGETTGGDVYQEPAPGHGSLINYPDFLSVLKARGYNGYLTSEYCLPVIRDHRIGGVEEVEVATKRALRYMRGIAGIA